MKKRKGIGFLAAAMALAMAGSIGTTQSMENVNPKTAGGTEQNAKSTPAGERKKRSYHKEYMGSSGGIPMLNHFTNYMMSPMEYGMRFGNGGSKKYKSNRLRYSHNAKVKRRTSNAR